MHRFLHRLCFDVVLAPARRWPIRSICARASKPAAPTSRSAMCSKAQARRQAAPSRPAPSPGQISSLPMSLLTAVASAAGLDFTPPAGVGEVRVVRPGGMRATLPAPSAAPADAPLRASIGVRRGDSVTLTFTAPGVMLSTRARALEDARRGPECAAGKHRLEPKYRRCRHRPRCGASGESMNQDKSIRAIALIALAAGAAGCASIDTGAIAQDALAAPGAAYAAAGRALAIAAAAARGHARRADRRRAANHAAAGGRSLMNRPAPIRSGARARAASSTTSAPRALATFSPS